MNVKYAVFIVLGTLFVMAFYYPFAHFVSAETNCYTFGQNYVCIFTADNVDPPAKALIWCDQNGQNCTITWASKDNAVTPEVKNLIDNAQAQVAQLDNQETTKDSKDVGGVNSNIPSGSPEIKKLP